MEGMKTFPEGEWSRYYRRADGVEALHARFVSHRYPRHIHDYFVVGLIDKGVQSFWCRGSRHITPAGCIGIVNPGDPHTGEAAVSEGYTYRTLYLPSAHLLRTGEEFGIRLYAPSLRGFVLRDPVLVTLLASFHDCLSGRSPNATQDYFLYKALARIVTQHSASIITTRSVGKELRAVSKAKEYMESRFDEDVSLSTLAEVVSLSPYYFARTFESEVGLPPHTYLEGVRIRKARECLDRGETIASAAVSVGYSDQSHLTRRFKRFLGITPGQYLREKSATNW